MPEKERSMLIISKTEIQAHYSISDAIKDIKLGLDAKKSGKIVNPHRTVISLPKYQASSLYMPSADLSSDIASIKVVSIFPENPKQGKKTTQGVLLLTDAATGEHICMMDASYLTRLRTGALSAIATDKLARANAKILGIIGTGAMAFEQVMGVLAVRELEKIVLYNRTLEKAVRFKTNLLASGVDIPVRVVNRSKEIVQVADIIICSTRSHEPVFAGKDLQPGTHINGIGSFLPSMREVDLVTIKRATQIVVDDLSSAKEEAGELIYAEKQSDFNFWDIVGELMDYELLSRSSDDEITFFKSVGSAYFDLVVATGIYKKAILLSCGQIVEI
jgi:ornithine cyclodeaminase/alanine dehydrogenase-like protein (mu-crystallin family)